ncbi:MAG: GNAT family N-acetyltransferase [bacterium]
MRIIDLTPEYDHLYHVCLEDWSDEIKEAGDHKKCWHAAMKEKGLRVKLALDDNGEVGGMIQYLPIEHSFVQGSDLYVIHCIWVHGYKTGRGNFQKKGLGKSLLQAAEDDVRSMGRKGIVAWGLALPFWMKASWFRRHGYKKADRLGISVLLWKSFSEDAVPPMWMKPKKTPQAVPEHVTITSFINGWCPAMNLVHERAKRAAATFGEKVAFNEIDTLHRENVLEWGRTDALFIDAKEVRTGPPPPYEKLRKKIEKRVKKL